jgi:hypothetical protein
MNVRIDECELEMALAAGTWRRNRAIRERLGAGHGERSYHWDRDITGAIAELAVAKALGCYWGGNSQDFGRIGDVGQLEVRGTRHPDGHLLVYMADPVEKPMVLVIVGDRGARIAGYLPPFAGREPRFLPPRGKLRDGTAVQWWVPQSALLPFEQLLAQLEASA